MYTVVDLKLPEGFSLETRHMDDFFNFEEAQGVRHRKLCIPVPDSGGQSIAILRYLVGETVLFRKSIMGLRLVRGAPEYHGSVGRVYLNNILSQAKSLQGQYRAMINRRDQLGGKRSIFSSNLCQEILLPTSYPRDTARLFEEMVGRRNLDAALQLDPVVDRGQRARNVPNRNEASRRYTGILTAADFDGDVAGIQDVNPFIVRPQVRTSGPRGSRDEWDQLQAYMGYVRHSNSVTIPRLPETPGPAPEYAAIPTAPVSLARAVDAVAEIVTGVRGTPPASRGPRPHNQRW